MTFVSNNNNSTYFNTIYSGKHCKFGLYNSKCDERVWWCKLRYSYAAVSMIFVGMLAFVILTVTKINYFKILKFQ